MKRIFLMMVLVSAIACNSDKKETTKGAVEKVTVEEPKKELLVKIEFKSNKTDEFKLSLNNILVDDFQSKNIQIVEKVQPTTESETIIASFGENNISNTFNISFGAKEVKTIDIQSFEISYGKNVITFPTSDLSKYFILNRFITQDPETGVLKTKKVDGKHNPIIILRPKTIKGLKKK